MSGERALRVGLTGGIASGKSAVLDRFEALGAVVIDSDVLARECVAPGTDGLAAVIARFGTAVLRPDGALDRSALAAVVFADDDARAALEAIVHPLVRAHVRRRFAAAPADSIVVNGVPLLVEAGLVSDYDVILVVEAPIDVRIARLAEARRLTRAESLARIDAQATDDERRAVAWRVITNDGTLAALHAQVDDVWRTLQAKREQI
ncbi:MAG: dephospho-CoA kinase [Acidothermaceae bacterium]